MAHMSRRFNFDDFDAQIAEALDDQDRFLQDAKMAREGVEFEEDQAWAEHDRVPGAIGAVLAFPTLPIEQLPEPPEAA